MSDGGKGSAPRPYSVDADTFASNWDRTFRGVVERSKTAGTSPAVHAGTYSPSHNGGSNPSTPAIFVNADTGEEVTEEWWP